jgi:hypothetical protein
MDGSQEIWWEKVVVKSVFANGPKGRMVLSKRMEEERERIGWKLDYFGRKERRRKGEMLMI